ncbi:MAG: hypothetical protein HY465_04230 [Deltaproteobacteria bacterium]|nr:hypothetical protein [Deltaproteobacteria bacterium]
MITIVAALAEELTSIRKLLVVEEQLSQGPLQFHRGQIGKRAVLLVQTGVGATAMQRAMTACWSHFTPSEIIHIGMAGGADPGLGVGDLVVANAVIDAISDASNVPSPELRRRAIELCHQHHLRVQEGGVVTSTTVVTDPHEKAFLGTKYGVHAIDMESFALAHACEEQRIPYLVLRSIFDPIDTPFPCLADVLDEGGSVDMPTLIAHLARHPRDVMALPRLAYAATKTRESLTRFVKAWMLNAA